MHERFRQRIKTTLGLEVSRGAGRWLDNSRSDLGQPIFTWNAVPLEIHERGATLNAPGGWSVSFFAIVDTKLADLQTLSQANLAPDQLLSLELITGENSYRTALPLYSYTAAASILGRVVAHKPGNRLIDASHVKPQSW